MSREWKAGDVAMVRREGESHATEHPAMLTEEDGWCCRSAGAQCTFPPVRPLVVIDPENSEQVARIVRAAWPIAVRQTEMRADLQQALREFANPTTPKPDEPTGLGAVVEDREGQRWMRDGLHHDRGNQGDWWCVTRAQDCSWDNLRAPWDGVHVVRVLSEGVQP